jgi:hypothetical protein
MAFPRGAFPPVGHSAGPPPPGLLAALGGGGPIGPKPETDDVPGTDPEVLVQKASDLIKRAIAAESDHEDKLLLEKITTECQQYLASQQKLGDTAMGAGPGAKMVRKATARAQAGPGY